MLGSFYKIIYETLLTINIILENELNFKVECNFFLLNSVFIKYFIITQKIQNNLQNIFIITQNKPYLNYKQNII